MNESRSPTKPEKYSVTFRVDKSYTITNDKYNLQPLFQLFNDHRKFYIFTKVLSIFTDNYGLYLEYDYAVKIPLKHLEMN